MKKGTKFAGIITPAVTPFTADEKIDEPLFRKELRYLIESGVHGISPGGSTGEGATLRDEELVRMIEIVKEETRGKLPIVAGVIRTSTQAAVTTATAAKKAGADALMVTPVFYNVLVPDAAGNTEFYRTISDEVGLPIVIYNVVPQNEISSELFSSLLEIKNVMGVKQSLGGIMAMYDMKLMCGDRGMIYSATDEMIYSCFSIGADGAISAILTLFPRLCVKMWDLNKAGRHEEALAIQNRLYPIWRVVRGAQFPARMKAALSIMGRDAGRSRSPMSEVRPEVRKQMEKLLANVRDE